jgi:hypothetical protein
MVTADCHGRPSRPHSPPPRNKMCAVVLLFDRDSHLAMLFWPVAAEIFPPCVDGMESRHVSSIVASVSVHSSDPLTRRAQSASHAPHAAGSAPRRPQSGVSRLRDGDRTDPRRLPRAHRRRRSHAAPAAPATRPVTRAHRVHPRGFVRTTPFSREFTIPFAHCDRCWGASSGVIYFHPARQIAWCARCYEATLSDREYWVATGKLRT